MPAARPTEAAIARAIRAAQRAGAGAVEIDRGVIRILVAPGAHPLPSPPDSDGEAAWDAAFGIGAAS
jgi:hypothetical protein